MDQESTPQNQPSPADWMQRFGAKVADLYATLAPEPHNELSSSITDLVSKYAMTDEHEASCMVPLALRKIFQDNARPKIRITFQQGEASSSLAEITEGDVA